ncbi:MAG TPA: hypothetical protein EYQ48_10930 [Candidatus Lambdaproteobacteria bacterium]|nr:hypothetical protein [Candidatus Lambdaproteobacteria bacterium]
MRTCSIWVILNWSRKFSSRKTIQSKYRLKFASNLINNFDFSEGSTLLSQWQAGDDVAQKRLRTLFDVVIEGEFDGDFQEQPSDNAVRVTTSLHLLTLTILNQLYGLNSKEFYKGDPQRYVRTTLMTQRLLGIRKLTLGWPVYAFGAEALGQATMYPDQHAPGADPGVSLVDRNNWNKLETPDFEGEVPRVIEAMLSSFIELTGLEPVAHLPAPYSLAADIFGQETLITALSHEPDFVVEFLENLTGKIIVPWCERLVQKFPNIWLELSDASGSPLFISPNLFQKIAAGPVLRLIKEFPWGNRVFVANYRGDMTTKTSRVEGRRGAGRRNRRGQQTDPETSSIQSSTNALNELIDFKLSLCPEFIIKLDADQSPLSIYMEHAIRREKPLYLGIGATRIDRNSIVDHEAAKSELEDLASNSDKAIKAVSKSLANKGQYRSNLSWPGDVYIEDVNAESDLGLLKTIIETLDKHGKMQL